MQNVFIKTEKKKEIIDITDEIEKILPVDIGLCNIFVKHDLAALAVADLGAGADPNTINAGSSISLPVSGGKFIFGACQRLALVELDGPREMEIVITFIEEE